MILSDLENLKKGEFVIFIKDFVSGYREHKIFLKGEKIMYYQYIDKYHYFIYDELFYHFTEDISQYIDTISKIRNSKINDILD